MQFTHEVLFYRTKLTGLQLQLFGREVLHRPNTGVGFTYDGGACLLVWTAQLLGGVGLLTPEQRRWLLDQMHDALHELGCSLGRVVAAGVPAELPAWILVLADGRYATWTTQVGFVDLTAGAPVQAPAQPLLESLSYNLVELFRRNYVRCQTIQRMLEEQGGRDASDSLAHAEAGPTEAVD